MFKLLFYIALVLGAVPLVLIYLPKRTPGNGVRYALPFLWLLFFSSIYELVATQIFAIPTEVWFRLYLLLEFAALLYFYMKLLGKRMRSFLYSYGVLFLLSFIVSVIYWHRISSMRADGFLSVLEIVFVYIASVAWFKNIFTELSETSLLHSAEFYFISGFILYFSGTLFLFLITDLIMNLPGVNFLDYWKLNIVFTFILRMLIVFGTWKGLQKSTKYSGWEQA